MINRAGEAEALRGLLRRHPIVGIIGARQVGKTTLARNIAASWRPPVVYYDLENPEDMARLSDPMLALKSAGGLVIIDEIQRHPDLFPGRRNL